MCPCPHQEEGCQFLSISGHWIQNSYNIEVHFLFLWSNLHSTVKRKKLTNKFWRFKDSPGMRKSDIPVSVFCKSVLDPCLTFWLGGQQGVHLHHQITSSKSQWNIQNKQTHWVRPKIYSTQEWMQMLCRRNQKCQNTNRF